MSTLYMTLLRNCKEGERPFVFPPQFADKKDPLHFRRGDIHKPRRQLRGRGKGVAK